MAAHLNFYENIVEAKMRLTNTIVLYGSAPYLVLLVSDHKPDNIFRIYLEPIGKGMRKLSTQQGSSAPPSHTYLDDESNRGAYMDKWMDSPKNSAGVIRKQMNSRYFKKFRPFPLGLVNIDGRVVYTERTPNRKMEQGLINNMVHRSMIDQKEGSSGYGTKVDIYGPEFRDCIMGLYPSPQECLEALNNPEISNESVAFDRFFGLSRASFGCLCLIYKNTSIGVLPQKDFSKLDLASSFHHLKEVVEELGLFQTINKV